MPARTLLGGPKAVAAALEPDRLQARLPVLVLDELHKHTKWKALLKGLFGPLPFEKADCFASAHPTVVPARTLLSQLL